ncbi:MAG: ABC transporter substrate-binding protein [Sulfitobacter sp.]|nr:ABC transporter substrate-binding protein [Sulfitobacter sp.]
MRTSDRPARIWAAAICMVVALAVTCTAQVARAEAPRRVVSINLCTDQLAMMLAGEGQLLSVSRSALDPNVSPLAEAAAAYRINHGQAEEIYLMQPDLVLAWVYTPRHTVDMLRKLGIRVELFDAVNSLDGIRDQVTLMGDLLNREAAAAKLVADFDRRRAALAGNVAERPSALIYSANGYTSGDGSLAHEILSLAGFRNAAVEAGYGAGRKMPLEVLALTDPDLVITSTRYAGGSRAEAVMDHPAVEALRDSRAATAVTDHDWVCGTPYVLRAAAGLADVRRRLAGAEG